MKFSQHTTNRRHDGRAASALPMMGWTAALLILLTCTSPSHAFTSGRTTGGSLPSAFHGLPRASANVPSDHGLQYSRRLSSSSNIATSAFSYPNRDPRRRRPSRSSASSSQLTTKADVSVQSDDDGRDESARKPNIFQKAKRKFIARPGTYLLIPCIAALVGWFTNYLAVQMIFYPVGFWGIPIWRRPEVPLGLLGWQGIVPCKTRTMSIAMVDMVTSQLLTVQQAFARLDPAVCAALLEPEVPKMGGEILRGVTNLPNFVLTTVPGALWNGMSTATGGAFRLMNHRVLTNLVIDMQRNIDQVFNLESCVVNQMLLDRAKLGELFRRCGEKELDFLTNSGLWFGFLLGLIQMAVALVWENPWSLSIGGGIVGLATNWLALKWIFEPVNPTKIGPFVLQGQFLRRQKEVAAEFSQFFAQRILNSASLWNSILTDPSTTPAFHSMFSKHFTSLCNGITGLVTARPLEAGLVGMMSGKTIEQLPNHVHVLHKYVDKTLGLQETLRVKMEAMTPDKFERVLHPIFEEDELTLILAGAVLGFIAGLIQQGLETGAIKISSPLPRIRRWLGSVRQFFRKARG